MSDNASCGELLSQIQRQVHVPKNRHNKFGNYKYRNAEDILDAVKKELPPGAIVTVSDSVELVGDRYYIKSVAALKYKDECISATAYARESLDKKGMDSAQVTGAASSYARKYAMGGLFAVDDGIDPDSAPPSNSGRTKAKVNDVFASGRESKSYKISDAQGKRMFAISRARGFSSEQLRDLVKSIGGVDSSKDLTKDAYEKIIDKMEAGQ